MKQFLQRLFSLIIGLMIGTSIVLVVKWQDIFPEKVDIPQNYRFYLFNDSREFIELVLISELVSMDNVEFHSFHIKDDDRSVIYSDTQPIHVCANWCSKRITDDIIAQRKDNLMYILFDPRAIIYMKKEIYIPLGGRVQLKPDLRISPFLPADTSEASKIVTISYNSNGERLGNLVALGEIKFPLTDYVHSLDICEKRCGYIVGDAEQMLEGMDIRFNNSMLEIRYPLNWRRLPDRNN